MLRDFEVVGVRTVKDLAASDPNELYERLCALTG
ncbi:MAG: helix-hairpin-helix domain-containing protein, partial [Acidobacteriota bacterium]|nr:helix-hairpin-helix domain-containing protein [Acidobacteriota bacterium]